MTGCAVRSALHAGVGYDTIDLHVKMLLHHTMIAETPIAVDRPIAFLFAGGLDPCNSAAQPRFRQLAVRSRFLRR